MYSKAKMLGHSLHPMLVHFPIAFYAGTLAAYVAYAASGNAFWFGVGVVANVAGVLTAALASVPGLIDWSMGIPREHPAKATGLQHMLLNVAALVLFAIDGWMQYHQLNEPTLPVYGAAVALSAVGMALTVAAGFLGSNMVERQHMAVDLTREQKRLDVLRADARSSSQPGARPA